MKVAGSVRNPSTGMRSTRAEHEVVLTHCVVHDRVVVEVLHAVDLDQQAHRLPPGVDVRHPVRSHPPDLPVRSWQSVRRAQRAEIELTEGLSPIADVPDHLVEQCAPRRVGDAGPGVRQLLAVDDPLLDAHRDQQGSRTVGARPGGRPQTGQFRSDPWNRCADDRTYRVRPVHGDPRQVMHPVSGRDADVHGVLVERPQTGRGERAHPVECSARSALPHGDPPAALADQVSPRQQHRVSPDEPPPAGADLGPQVSAGHPFPKQVCSVRDSTVICGDARERGRANAAPGRRTRGQQVCTDALVESHSCIAPRRPPPVSCPSTVLWTKPAST